MILATRFTFIVERSWKNMYFHPNWFDHLLLMASYPVTIATDHHWTWLKMCARDERTDTKTSGANVLSSRKKNSEKPYGGLHPPPLVRPRLKLHTTHLLCWKLNEKEKFEKRSSCLGKNEENSLVTSHVTWFYRFAEISVFESKNENLKWYDFAK